MGVFSFCCLDGPGKRHVFLGVERVYLLFGRLRFLLFGREARLFLLCGREARFVCCWDGEREFTQRNNQTTPIKRVPSDGRDLEATSA